MKKALLTLTAIIVFCTALCAVSVNGYIDLAVDGSTPAAPPSGKGRLYVNSSNQLTCLNSDGSACLVHPSTFQNTQMEGFVRTFNTVFQNTTPFPLYVSVSVIDQGGGSDVDAKTDAQNPPFSFVAEASPAAMASATIFFIVLPGNFYEVIYDGGLGTWSEWSQ